MKLAGGGLDLRAFLLRAQVLGVYRKALRVAYRGPVEMRAELLAEIRKDIEVSRHVDDPAHVKWLLSDALKRIKDLSDMMNLRE